jgi:hypothetical protein
VLARAADSNACRTVRPVFRYLSRVRLSDKTLVLIVWIGTLAAIADDYVRKKDDTNHRESDFDLAHVSHDKLIIMGEEKAQAHHNWNRDQRSARVDEKESRERKPYGATHKKSGGADIEQVSRHHNSENCAFVEVLANKVKAFGCEVSPKPFFSKECGPGEPTDSIYEQFSRENAEVTDGSHEPEIDLLMIRDDSSDNEG